MTSYNKENFTNYYKNLETNKDFYANIYIWNIQKSLIDLFDTNPPWKICPSHTIKNAHYDTILDFKYLPISQLIVSCSLDKTIKIWDPVARPYSLTNPQNLAHLRVKPGYYKDPESEFTRSNTVFIIIIFSFFLISY